MAVMSIKGEYDKLMVRSMLIKTNKNKFIWKQKIQKKRTFEKVCMYFRSGQGMYVQKKQKKSEKKRTSFMDAPQKTFAFAKKLYFAAMGLRSMASCNTFTYTGAT